jgi:NAD-dependent deacetylase
MTSDCPEMIVLTGAGVSAESGIATFRGTDGLWEGHRIEDVASPEGFARNPQLVHRFYNLRRAALRTVQPNAAHSALAQLEAAWPGAFLLVTQNVDDLHERVLPQSLLAVFGEGEDSFHRAAESI